MNPLVEAARRYVGLRFRHRGRKTEGPGKGVDCAGLGVVAYRDCGVTLKDFDLYEREPATHGPTLVDRMAETLGEPVLTGPVKAEDLQEGDVVVFRYVKEPHHVAIIGRHPRGHHSIIHADGNLGKYSRVLEVGLAPDVMARITHVFRRPV